MKEYLSGVHDTLKVLRSPPSEEMDIVLRYPDGHQSTLTYPEGVVKHDIRSEFGEPSRPVGRSHRPTGRQRPDEADDSFDGQLYHGPKHLGQSLRGARMTCPTKRKCAPLEPVILGERPTARPRRSARVMPVNAPPPADAGGDPNSDDGCQTDLIEVHNDDQVKGFYRGRFLSIQQLACKFLAKAWIKVCEPKKQSHYPYRGGTPTAPPWWPPTTRHKEPDHLKRKERLDLLVFIIMERPNTTVEKLKECADEITADDYVRRKCILDDLFLVAMERSRTRDPTTTVPVLKEPRILLGASTRAMQEEEEEEEREEDELEEEDGRNAVDGDGDEDEPVIKSEPVIKTEPVIKNEPSTDFPFIKREYDEDGDVRFDDHFRADGVGVAGRGMGAMEGTQSMMWPGYGLDVGQHESSGGLPSAALGAGSESQPYIISPRPSVTNLHHYLQTSEGQPPPQPQPQPPPLSTAQFEQMRHPALMSRYHASATPLVATNEPPFSGSALDNEYWPRDLDAGAPVPLGLPANPSPGMVQAQQPARHGNGLLGGLAPATPNAMAPMMVPNLAPNMVLDAMPDAMPDLAPDLRPPSHGLYRRALPPLYPPPPPQPHHQHSLMQRPATMSYTRDGITFAIPTNTVTP